MNHALTYKIESTFIEIINTKKADIVVCCVFNDPKMDVTEYNNHLKEMLKKVFNEQKKFFFLETSILIFLNIICVYSSGM